MWKRIICGHTLTLTLTAEKNTLGQRQECLEEYAGIGTAMQSHQWKKFWENGRCYTKMR